MSFPNHAPQCDTSPGSPITDAQRAEIHRIHKLNPRHAPMPTLRSYEAAEKWLDTHNWIARNAAGGCGVMRGGTRCGHMRCPKCGSNPARRP